MTLLKSMLLRKADQKVSVAGVVDKGDNLNRDLFVDNCAGMAREIANEPEGRLATLFKELGDNHRILYNGLSLNAC